MTLAQKIHRITVAAALVDADEAELVGISGDLTEKVMTEVSTELENPSLYRHLQQVLPYNGLTDDDLAALDEKHKTTLQKLEEKVDEAKESAGDMEVLDARLEIARFAAKSLSMEEAIEAYEKVLALPKLSSGKTIDALMEESRVASFYGDTKKNAELVERVRTYSSQTDSFARAARSRPIVCRFVFRCSTNCIVSCSPHVLQAAKLAEDGGDWDRRNRLKVYSALSKILARDVKEAAALLIDCIATFSCAELCPYPDFVVYTIITNILNLARPELKEKIIDGPDILTVADKIPVVVRIYVYKKKECERLTLYIGIVCAHLFWHFHHTYACTDTTGQYLVRV
jgi:26S proteasome regulatory subunit N7